MTATHQLCSLDATVLAGLLQSGAVSAENVMSAFLERIHQFNPRVNAICTLIDEDQAMAMARDADKRRSSGQPLGPLHGVPMACKDLVAVKGMRTTFGSRAMANNVPDYDHLVAERLRSAGALIIGKTNIPEFGAGSHTFNELFGTTNNPYSLDRTAGGSSGGAAAALAARMLPLADGSDMGGSLRNPAAFCNVVGLRPSMGRVPSWPTAMAWQSRLGIEGPMARNVDDLALLLSVLAGPDSRDPRSLNEPGSQFRTVDDIDPSELRIGYSADLGFLPLEPAVRSLFESAISDFHAMGCEISTDVPELNDAMDVFRTLRANFYAAMCGPMLEQHRDILKQTLVANTELGLKLSAQDLARADVTRTEIYQRMHRFFENHDALVLPSTQVMPFNKDNEWVEQINGTPMSDYLEWMTICCVVTVTDLPVISVPCGFDELGLPAGLQIVGRPGADLTVMKIAKAFMAKTRHGDREPLL